MSDAPDHVVASGEDIVQGLHDCIITLACALIRMGMDRSELAGLFREMADVPHAGATPGRDAFLRWIGARIEMPAPELPQLRVIEGGRDD